MRIDAESINRGHVQILISIQLQMSLSVPVSVELPELLTQKCADLLEKG